MTDTPSDDFKKNISKNPAVLIAEFIKILQADRNSVKNPLYKIYLLLN